MIPVASKVSSKLATSKAPFPCALCRGTDWTIPKTAPRSPLARELFELSARVAFCAHSIEKHGGTVHDRERLQGLLRAWFGVGWEVKDKVRVILKLVDEASQQVVFLENEGLVSFGAKVLEERRELFFGRFMTSCSALFGDAKIERNAFLQAANCWPARSRPGWTRSFRALLRALDERAEREISDDHLRQLRREVLKPKA